MKRPRLALTWQVQVLWLLVVIVAVVLVARLVL
jgi:hypothetical protein